VGVHAFQKGWRESKKNNGGSWAGETWDKKKWWVQRRIRTKRERSSKRKTQNKKEKKKKEKGAEADLTNKGGSVIQGKLWKRKP